MTTAAASSSCPGRPPLMTGDQFLAWHHRWEQVLRRAYGEHVMVSDYATRWAGSVRSLFDYRRRYLPKTGRSTE